MANVCMVTGRKTQVGHNVAHCNKKTLRTFEPNLHDKRFWVASQKRYVKLRVSCAGLRTINRYGIEHVLALLVAQGINV
ncbi:MAG: 50S ribosomal protein L28 [Pseudomonadota bacterium]